MPLPAGPSPTLPAWAPDRQRVAAYIPRRTHVGSGPGWGTIKEVFDTTTKPTGAAVDSIILAACNWILIKTGALHESLHEPGADLAALRAAGLVELTFPDNREDITDGQELLKQADAMRKDLAAANIALTADDPAVDEASLLPDFWFPTVADEVTW